MYLIPKPKQIEKRRLLLYDLPKRNCDKSHFGGKQPDLCHGFKKEIEKWAGMRLLVQKGLPQSGDIYLTLDAALGSQAYRLTITEEGIVAAGGDGAGVRYAVQTLCQIIEQCGGSLMCMQIEDAPKLLHRGYFLDETRGRVLKLDYLKKVVDRLSRYKLNEFQLYIEHTYLFRDLSEMWRDETPLTAEEIMELDVFCKERYIELVPSLASFGHLYTLLSTKSYGDLCEFSDAEKQPFSFDDRMHHHTINAADDRTFPLIEHMLEEYMALFSSNKFNICADETFDLGKGKTKKLADEKGVHRIYIDYVKALCEFLVEKENSPCSGAILSVENRN